MNIDWHVVHQIGIKKNVEDKKLKIDLAVLNNMMKKDK